MSRCTNTKNNQNTEEYNIVTKLNIFDEINNVNQSNLIVMLDSDSENNLIDQIRYTTYLLKRNETDSDNGVQ